MSLKESKKRFIEGVVELLWRQWGAFGVSSHVNSETHAILDLEALIVCSSWAARFDERLYDLVLCWLIAHGDVVNLQRLKAIAARSLSADLASLRYMAGVVSQHGGRKWMPVADVDLLNGDPVKLFLAADGSEVQFCPRRDELALRYGFVRVPFQARNVVVKPDITTSATAILRLRGLCGISARADVLAVLLNGAARTSAELALHCGYSWKSTNEALRELVSSGLLQELRVSVRSSAYKLKNVDRFASMLMVRGCTNVNWPKLFETISDIWFILSNPRLELVSSETISGELERLVAKINSDGALVEVDMPSDIEQLFSFPQSIVDKYFK